MDKYTARERTLSVEKLRRVWRAADKIGSPNCTLSLGTAALGKPPRVASNALIEGAKLPL